MKYNLRTIKGKRIVGGDPNLATKHEIHVSKIAEELDNIESSEGVKYYYYKYVHSEEAWSMFTMLCSPFYMEYLVKGVGDFVYINTERPGESGDLVGFKLVGVPQIGFHEIRSDVNPTIEYLQLDGDIFSRMTKIISTMGTEITRDQLREALKANFIEISKEEYDTLYTKLDIV